MYEVDNAHFYSAAIVKHRSAVQYSFCVLPDLLFYTRSMEFNTDGLKNYAAEST